LPRELNCWSLMAIARFSAIARCGDCYSRLRSSDNGQNFKPLDTFSFVAATGIIPYFEMLALGHGGALLAILFALIPLVVSGITSFPYSLGVRDSLMIAHSFHQHPAFGPAGGMHGATYTCDVEFLTDKLNPETNWVIDIGKASDIVSDVLSKYNLQNLDEVFGEKVMTTTEFMARQIHDDIKDRLDKECSDFEGVVRVKLFESHKAWATYTSLT
jgi:6-pyruvoyltetrahydropterin/6-carboxytetrahydropterin synthase